MNLNDKVAVITGGASGIGEATAKRFAAAGATIVIVDLDATRAEAVVQTLPNAASFPTDVADATSVEDMVQHVLHAHGHVDILVNNAAIGSATDLVAIDEAEWDQTLNVVLKSVFLCSKGVLPAMIERRGGVIVNIASVNGLMGIGEEPYSAAKAGVINLTKNLAVQYGRHNIRANVICPGTVRTPIWQSRVAQDPEIFEKLATWYPLGRVGEPDDIAQAALFLASDAAAWITGAVIPVDGGLTAGSYRMGQELG